MKAVKRSIPSCRQQYLSIENSPIDFLRPEEAKLLKILKLDQKDLVSGSVIHVNFCMKASYYIRKSHDIS